MRYHKLIRWTGGHVWVRNTEVYKQQCTIEGCPGKPVVYAGHVLNQPLEKVWYMEQDIVKTMGESEQCKKCD